MDETICFGALKLRQQLTKLLTVRQTRQGNKPDKAKWCQPVAKIPPGFKNHLWIDDLRSKSLFLQQKSFGVLFNCVS